MTTQSANARQFHRAEIRAEFERARRELNAAALEPSATSGASRLLELSATLDAGVARCKPELFGNSLCWNDDNLALVAWICRQHRGLVALGTRLVQALAGDAASTPELRTRLTALTLHHWGQSIKWAPTRERPEYAAVHDLMSGAVAEGRQRIPFSWVSDGRGRTTTIESMYLRALLLDRFASGSLTRVHQELFDAWLWEWDDALRALAGPVEGAVLRVDLDANAGLREGVREGDGDTLYLPLARLERKRREVVQSLQRGAIVPAHGCAADFRIEDHITLLDHLQRAFRAGADARHRAPRRHAAGTRVEVWVGLSEILTRGINVGIETGKWRRLDLHDAAIEKTARERFSDASRRYFWLVDTSQTGLGFEAMGTDAAGIEIGDLLGWRTTTGGPVILGTVIRCLAGAIPGQVFLGVRVLTPAAQPITLVDEAGRGEAIRLFVPGDDSSGRHDAFLVAECDYELAPCHKARVGGQEFALRYNRIRGRGRGWVLAGFEIVPQETPRARPQAESPRLELVLASDAETAHAFDRELSSRLLM
ncbi:MAG TPA: hypothetical protein VM073_12125 [Usitatibacter sp.]|nr:hypothetical protein [Usitatibacter sp.]